MAEGDAVADMKLPLEEGLLGQLLHSPVYNLFPSSVVFESNFIQVPPHSLGHSQGRVCELVVEEPGAKPFL